MLKMIYWLSLTHHSLGAVSQEERSRRERVRKSRVDELEAMDVDHGEVYKCFSLQSQPTLLISVISAKYCGHSNSVHAELMFFLSYSRWLLGRC